MISTSTAPPADYQGPLWYWLSRVGFSDKTGYPFSLPPKASSRLFGENEGMRIFTSGLVLNADGMPLAPFDKPLVCKKTSKSPKHPAEYIPSTACQIISERVYDAIVALDGRDKIFIALDVVDADAPIERWYAMFFGRSELRQFLFPQANRLETIARSDGSLDFKTPDWLLHPEKHAHFGYLDAAAIAGRHLFSRYSGTPFFSQVLAEKIGDAFSKDYRLFPIGVA